MDEVVVVVEAAEADSDDRYALFRNRVQQFKNIIISDSFINNLYVVISETMDTVLLRLICSILLKF